MSRFKSEELGHAASRRIRRGRPGQRGTRQADRLGAGLPRAAGGGHRAPLRGRLLPEHRLPAEQEHHPRRQGGELFPQGRRVRDIRRRLEGRHGRRPRTQAEDGGRAGRDAPREVPGQRRGARHGERAFRGAQDHRGRAELRGHADAPRPGRSSSTPDRGPGSTTPPASRNPAPSRTSRPWSWIGSRST